MIEKINGVDFINNYLVHNEQMYLCDSIHINDKKDLKLKDLCLYKINEVCFDDKAPRKEALENVMTSLRIDGINFVFLIIGDSIGTNFYYGISKDLSFGKNNENSAGLQIYDIGKSILKSEIEGNFRGSKIEEVSSSDKEKIIEVLNNMTNSRVIEGVPGANKDDEKFQGIDRLINVMHGTEYAFVILAKPLDLNAMHYLQKNMYNLYTEILSPSAKINIQSSSGKNIGYSKTESSGSSSSEGVNYSKSTGESTNKGTSKGTSTTTNEGTSSSSGSSSSSSGSSKGTSRSGNESTNESYGESESESKGSSSSTSTSENTSEGTSTGESTSNSTSFEINNKEVQDWIKYLDDVIFPRIDYGKGKGLFLTTMAVFSKGKDTIEKLKNTVIALYSGESGNRIPLNANIVGNDICKKIKSFQLPYGNMNFDHNKRLAHLAMSQYIDSDNNGYLGNWITTNELGLIAGLPQKEIVGLALSEEVEFGLNANTDMADSDKIELGNLVQNGNELVNNKIYLNKKDLDKHIFITGVTGSGKTTTCQKILKEADMPFLVIEPAKTEYRILKNEYPDMLIFTIGDNTAPFRMNPFVLYPHESITSRVDMIKACIESAFDMEAAIPQIIESALYKCYEDYGWNISTNENRKFEHPFQDGCHVFPTLSDLVENCSVIVETQGFDDRLKNDYIGSIRARLLGLLVGNKGFLLNSRQSIDFTDLLNRRVVFELENIRSSAEKSLIMGFILINLNEAIKEKSRQAVNGRVDHITLVEEAHRLLSKFSAGDSPSKKHGVEMFADMLAEIRKYGESLIIADQIPNKLTPEVLKNTNTKIIHRIFAADDKEAIGNTIMLEDNQKRFLSVLKAGRTVYFSSGYDKAIQLQIKAVSDTSEKIVPNEELIKNVRDYYIVNYKKSLIDGLELFDKEPSILQYNAINELNNGVFEDYFDDLSNDTRNKLLHNKYKTALKKVIDIISKDLFYKYIKKYKKKYGFEFIVNNLGDKEYNAIISLNKGIGEEFLKELIQSVNEKRMPLISKEIHDLIEVISKEAFENYIIRYNNIIYENNVKMRNEKIRNFISMALKSKSGDTYDNYKERLEEIKIRENINYRK